MYHYLLSRAGLLMRARPPDEANRFIGQSILTPRRLFQRSEVPETNDSQNASSKPNDHTDQNKYFAATVVNHPSRENIQWLLDSASTDPHPKESVANPLHLHQSHCVRKDSIPSSLAQETNVCQKATNESDFLVCRGRSSIAILLACF